MPSAPLVSVVIPAYNAERYLGAAVASVLAQTYPSVEVVIVDDGSTDGTRALAERLAAGDARVRVIAQPNGGAARARNAGIEASRGVYVAPLDADDLWAPEKLAAQVACAEAHADIGLVYCWSYVVDVDGRPTGTVQTGDAAGDVYDVLLLDFVVGNGSCQLFRRSALDRVGLYDPAIGTAEDFDLCLRVAEHYRVAVVPRLLVAYREVPGSISHHLARMIGSYDAVIASARRRTADLPRDILRWSRSNTLGFYAGRAATFGRYPQALRLLGRVAATDPARLLASWPWRTAARCVRGLWRQRRAPAVAAPLPRERPLAPLAAGPVLEPRVPPGYTSLRERRLRAWWKPAALVEAHRWRRAHRAARRRADALRRAAA